MIVRLFEQRDRFLTVRDALCRASRPEALEREHAVRPPQRDAVSGTTRLCDGPLRAVGRGVRIAESARAC